MWQWQCSKCEQWGSPTTHECPDLDLRPIRREQILIPAARHDEVVEGLRAEVERLRELNRDTRDRLADWHEDNLEVMVLVDGATNNEGDSLSIIQAVRAWLDSVPT